MPTTTTKKKARTTRAKAEPVAQLAKGAAAVAFVRRGSVLELHTDADTARDVYRALVKLGFSPSTI